MNYKNGEEDDESLLLFLLQAGKSGKLDKTCDDLPSRSQALAVRLIEDIQSPFRNSKVFWDRIDTSARKLGFSTAQYRVQDGFWEKYISPRASTEDFDKVPSIFHSHSDHGKNHLFAVSALLKVSVTRAAALTLDAVRLTTQPSTDHAHSFQQLSSLLGSMELLRRVRDFYYSQQVARIRFLTEALRFESQNNDHPQAMVDLISTCRHALHTIDDFSHVRLDIHTTETTTWKRGCFQLLLTLACSQVVPLDRTNVDPATQTLHSYHSASIATSYSDEVTELLLAHERHYDQVIRTEALECLLVLLYEHMHQGVHRCDYLWMLLAFERQCFFVPRPPSQRDTTNNRNTSLVSMILAESMCFWRTFPSAYEDGKKTFWMDVHPLFFAGEQDSHVEYELNIILKLLLDTFAVSCVQRKNQLSNQTNSYGDGAPEAVAIFTFGLLLKLAMSLISTNRPHETISVRYSFILNWEDRVARCISTANDVCGVFDYFHVIFSDLLPPSPATKTSLKKHGLKLFRNSDDWERFSTLAYDNSDFGERSAVVGMCDKEPNALSIFEDETVYDSPEPASIMTFAIIGREIMMATISALRTNLINSKFSTENMTLMCRLTSKIYRNDAVLCEQFWSDWDHCMGQPSQQVTVDIDPICSLLDASYNRATSALTNILMYPHEEKVQALPLLSPFFNLLASLIPLNNPSIIDDIITNFLPDKMIHVCLLGIFHLYAPSISNVCIQHDESTKKEYLYSAITILESIQIFACLATLSRKSSTVQVLRDSVHLRGDQEDARFGVRILFGIAKRALRNEIVDSNEREVVVSSCLAIIGDLCLFTQLCDCPWIHRIGSCLMEERFEEFLFCGSDIISSRACFVLQRVCASLLPITFFYEQDEMSARTYLKTIELISFSLIDILVSTTPRDYCQVPPSHIRMDLIYSSLTYVFTFLKAIGFISEYHYSNDIKRLCNEIHERTFTLMKSCNFIGHTLVYYLILPHALGLSRATAEDEDSYQLVTTSVTNDSHSSGAEEKKVADHLHSVVLPSRPTIRKLSESIRPSVKGDEELGMDAIDNAYAALHTLTIWADRDKSFDSNDTRVMDIVDISLSYICIDVDVDRSPGMIELFKASVKFLLWYAGSCNAPGTDKLLLNEHVVKKEYKAVNFSTRYMTRRFYSIIAKSLIDAMNDFHDRLALDFGERITQMEKIATLSCLFITCLNRNFLLVSFDSEQHSLLFNGFVLILDRYKTKLESKECKLERRTFSSCAEIQLVSASIQSLIAMWDARESQILTYSDSESSANDRLLSFCVFLIQDHASSAVGENVGQQLKLLRLGLMLFCRLIRHDVDELSVPILLQKCVEKSNAEPFISRLKKTYQKLPETLRSKGSWHSDWIGFFGGLGLQIGADPSLQAIADFYGTLCGIRQFYMLFPIFTALLRIYDQILQNRKSQISSTQGAKSKNALISLHATISLVDQLLDLLTTGLNSFDAELLWLSMNSIRSLTESVFTSFAAKDLADMRNPPTAAESAEYKEQIVLLSHACLQLSFLSSSALDWKNIQDKFKLNLLATALEALYLIESSESSATLDIEFMDACVNLVRVASSCVHQNLNQFTVAFTTRKPMAYSDSRPLDTWKTNRSQGKSAFLSPHISSLLRTSMALIESVRRVLLSQDEDAPFSILRDCNVVDDTINHFIILSDAIVPSPDGEYLSTSDCEDIIDILVSIVDFLCSLSESVPQVFLERRSITRFLKCNFFAWLLNGSKPAIMPEMQCIFLGLLTTLSTLLCSSQLAMNKRTVSDHQKILGLLAVETIDFIKTFGEAITMRINDAFTVNYDRDSDPKLKRLTILSSARSTYAPSLTVNKLKEAREILTLLNELFHPFYIKFGFDRDLHQKLLNSCLNCFKAQSLFLGSISAARELFSLLRMVDNNLRPLASHTCNHLQDAMIRHPILSDGIPYARSEAISYAHFASSCCISVSKEENDMRNTIISNRLRKDSTEESIDQSYEDGISNKFVTMIETLSMECAMLALSIIDKAHSAGSLVLFSHGEAVLLNEVVQPTSIVSYSSPKGRNIQTAEEPFDPSYSITFGRVLRYNSVRRTVDIRRMNADIVDADVSCSQLIFIEDIKKRKHVFQLAPAPRSFSDLASNAVFANVSTGHLIYVLRWCRQRGLRNDMHSRRFDEILQYLAKMSALLLGTEINIHMDLETLKRTDTISIRDINNQVRDLLEDFESRMEVETQTHALRCLIGDAVWAFTNDAISQLIKFE